jgi:catechol 2,3-dioxygenase
MSHHRVPVRDDGRALSFEDPWANAIRLVSSHPAG